MAISAGEKLGRYEILAAIGAGGMGEVYKARDTQLNRFVAFGAVLYEMVTGRKAFQGTNYSSLMSV